jgi:hypothetical protein
MPGLLPVVVNDLIVKDREQPGSRGAPLLKFLKRLKSVQEGVLYKIFSHGLITGFMKGPGIQFITKPINPMGQNVLFFHSCLHMHRIVRQTGLT